MESLRTTNEWNNQWINEGKIQDVIFNNSYSFRRLKEYIKESNIKVCEFGCGGGLWLKFFKDLGCSVYGVDTSQEGLNLANQRVIGDLRFESVEKTSFNDNEFDLVFSLGLLEHFNDEQIISILKEKIRVSKSKVVVSVPNRSKLSMLWLYELFTGRCKDERVLSKRDLINLFEKAGLKQIEAKYGGLFIPILRNRSWFNRLNLKWLENRFTSDYIIARGVK